MTRRIPREEGIFVGNSAGSAMAGLVQMKDMFKAGDVVVVIFHDHGTRYLGKMFNDDWMRDRGFLEEEKKTALDLIKDHIGKHLVSVSSDTPVSQAILLMNQYNISQIPVMDNNVFVGSLNDNYLFKKLIETPELKELPVRNVMQESFPIVKAETTFENVSKHFQNGVKAVLVNYDGNKHHIITQQDMIRAIG
jgi:cystathionine beta-synthase